MADNAPLLVVNAAEIDFANNDIHFDHLFEHVLNMEGESAVFLTPTRRFYNLQGHSIDHLENTARPYLGLRNLSTASLCKDASRNDRLTFDMAGCHFDLTQQRIDQAALDQLFQLADRANFDRLRHALFAGNKINLSEDRAVLHMALRDGAPHIDPALIADVKSVRNKLYTCAESIRSGTWRGYTNKPIRNVVHIGIGGSHLGPELVTEALHEYATTNLDIRFVANIDGYDLSRALKSLDPETTLFIVASKSFSTLETLENARSARAWFLERTIPILKPSPSTLSV